MFLNFNGYIEDGNLYGGLQRSLSFYKFLIFYVWNYLTVWCQSSWACCHQFDFYFIFKGFTKFTKVYYKMVIEVPNL
jgi:hypothetical protein